MTDFPLKILSNAKKSSNLGLMIIMRLNIAVLVKNICKFALRFKRFLLLTDYSW